MSTLKSITLAFDDGQEIVITPGRLLGEPRPYARPPDGDAPPPNPPIIPRPYLRTNP